MTLFAAVIVGAISGSYRFTQAWLSANAERPPDGACNASYAIRNGTPRGL